MKRFNPRLTRSGPALLAALFLLAATLAGAQARRPLRSSPQRTFVAGEIILYAYPGTPLADVQKAVAAVQPASLTPLLLPDCYHLVLPQARRDDADTLSAIATLKTDPHVRWVGPNRLYTLLDAPPTVVPNDPMYPQQWNLPLINMPQAWVLQKGQPNANVAWIDSGYDPQHEDAVGQFLPGSYDFADNDSDVTADGTGVAFDHGTHTSGIAIAITNNGKGIAGIDWQNIKILALKVAKKGQDVENGLDGSAILQSYAYIAAHKDDYHIVACNMSYGAAGENPNDTSDPSYAAIKACVDKGIIMVASAGNSAADNTIQVPSGYPFVVSVSATNPKGLLSSYSSFGKVDLAAPGGEQTSDTDPNGVLSLHQNSKYGFAQGTSDAAPHVTAVAALMMSTPGVTPQKAVQVMEQTANRASVAGAVPDAKYGFGLLDAYQALLKVSVSAVILQPQGVDPTGQNGGGTGIVPPLETLKPLLMFRLGNVPPANFTITIDGNSFTWADIQNKAVPGVSEVLTPQGNTSGDNPAYTIGFRYTFPNTAPFQHTITITGVNPASGTTSTDTRIITIQPHTIPSGTTFVSIPYYEGTSSPTGQFRDANQLLPGAILSRWINTQVTNTNGTPATVGRYAIYGAGTNDPLARYASFLPPDVVPQLSPATDPVTGLTITDPRPVGLAWFVQSTTPIQVLTYGIDLPNQAVKIPLHEGWNMVGDPFRFQVPFNAAQIQLPNGTSMSVAAAVDQNRILPNLYHLVNGQYQFETLPEGAFNPWEGHWVFVVPQNLANVQSGNTLFLVIPPTQVSNSVGSPTGTQAALKRSATAASAMGATGSGGWSVQLEARTRSLADSYNYIGMSSRATTSNDATKVPKPPLPAPYVSVGIARQNSPAGIYAQDLQPLGGAKSWDIVVSTDQADSDVVLSWAGMTAVPRNYRLTLTDKVSGQTVDMRQQASYKFHTGHPAASRSFVVTARPTIPEGRALLTDVFINPGRSAGGRAASAYEIGYTVSQDARVDISILSLGGRMLGQISPTRAVTSGQNSAVWNGLDSTGRTLPAGTYVLQIRAVTASGDLTRLVHPFLITGR